MKSLDTDIYLLIFSAIFLIFAFAYFIIFLFLNHYKKRQKLLAEKELLKFNFQQTLLQSQLEIQEQTLQNISQEIHDNIGQVLSLTKINLSTMDMHKPDELQQKLDDSKKLVSKAIQDLRDLSKSLNSDYVTELGLLRAIEYNIEMIRKTGSLQTQLDVTGTPIRLDAQKELILFRMVQEAINNILKHAEATLLTITVEYGTQNFMISVADNGKGFDNTGTESSIKKTGIGLSNLHNRSRLVGAEVTITSTPGAGTTVTILLPAKAI
ncbi:MAG: sensor histidine kinase [Chitinophagaceae bacterium]